jgi:hypothetical protein
MNIQKDHVLHSRNGKFGHNTSQVADVVRILDSDQAAASAQGLVIHFHGGLNSREAALGIASDLAPKYEKAGAYPLFFVWESGLIESIKNNLQDILADPAFRELVKKASEWALKKLGGQVGLKGGAGQTINENQLRKEFDTWFNGASTEPPVTDEGKVLPTPTMKGAVGLNEDDLADEIDAGLDGDPDFQNAIQKLHNAIAVGTTATKGAGTKAVANVVMVDDRALNDMFPGTTATTKGGLVWILVAKFVAKIVIKVVRRYANGRAHGMYCTIVEEVLRAAYLDKVGATVWNQMKKDTVDSFGSDSQCCGTAVAKQLGDLYASGKTFKKITLVGHSTGAVYICEFLDAASKYAPELKFDIVFLAPAVRHDRFANALAMHQNRMAGFRMFGMSDGIESDDVLLPMLYTRSLLYFVSGVLEGHVEDDAWESDIDAPILGMQRYITDKNIYNPNEFPEVEQVRQFLQSTQDSEIWSDSSAGNGLNSTSHKHGDFDNDVATVNSLLWIIGH